MTEPVAVEPDRKLTVTAAQAGSALEILAMVLASAAGFAAPTDWNITLGLAIFAGCLFALGFFAFDNKPDEPAKGA